MLKFVKRGIAITALSVMMLSLPVAAFAEASMDFSLIEMTWVDGQGATAKGTFTNTGDKEITKVDKVDVKIFLDDAVASDVYFDNIDANIKPGESANQEFIFPDITQEAFDAAATWDVQEGEWTFTYLEE